MCGIIITTSVTNTPLQFPQGWTVEEFLLGPLSITTAGSIAFVRQEIIDYPWGSDASIRGKPCSTCASLEAMERMKVADVFKNIAGASLMDLEEINCDRK